jgi:hypothetical protein
LTHVFFGFSGGYEDLGGGVWKKESVGVSQLNINPSTDTENVQGFGTVSHIIGIKAADITSFSLKDLRIVLPDAPSPASPPARGVSVYGIHMRYFLLFNKINVGFFVLFLLIFVFFFAFFLCKKCLELCPEPSRNRHWQCFSRKSWNEWNEWSSRNQ